MMFAYGAKGFLYKTTIIIIIIIIIIIDYDFYYDC